MKAQAVRRLTAFVVTSIVASMAGLALSAPAAWSQAPVDAPSLIGAWAGTWTEKHTARATGRYYLWIETVEGSKVGGRGEVVGRRNTEFRFRGTLEGNRLTFGRDPVTELLIDGGEMRGGSRGSFERDIVLRKQK